MPKIKQKTVQMQQLICMTLHGTAQLKAEDFKRHTDSVKAKKKKRDPQPF